MKWRIIVSLLIILSLLYPFLKGEISAQVPLNLILVWHHHQPYYSDPTREGFMYLPWVRLHSSKNYYRMAELVSQHPEIKVTFDLSGSLIHQIEEYIKGATDLREILSRKEVPQLSIEEKMAILSVPGGMFDISWSKIIETVPRFKELLNKRQEAFKLYDGLKEPERSGKITAHFTSQDYQDLIALFNLHWLDPEYARRDPKLSQLLKKGETGELYTRGDIDLILKHQRELIGKVIPAYKDLLKRGQAEIVPTPYSHPILPLFNAFGLGEDAILQVEKGIDIFQKHFSAKPAGMWSPECAINEDSVLTMASRGIKWTLGDEGTLAKAGVDTKDPIKLYQPYLVEKDGLKIAVFFRDTHLSNQIGFKYSGMTAEEAVVDFTKYILDKRIPNTDGKMAITVALDGENAWEWYPNNGNDFLHLLYKRLAELQKEGKIKTLTPSEYLARFEPSIMPKSTQEVLDLKDKDLSLMTHYRDLPKKTKEVLLPEGSWAGDLSTWIGEKQENVAWMWYLNARKAWVEGKDKMKSADYARALGYLLASQTSCWFWWYGTDQDSGFDSGFSRLYQLNLYRLYEISGKIPPSYLLSNSFPDGATYLPVTPDRPLTDMISPTIDGELKEEEWAKGAKYLTPNSPLFTEFLVGADTDNLYLGLKPRISLSPYYGTLKNLEIGLFKYCSSWKETNFLFMYQKMPAVFAIKTFPLVEGHPGSPINQNLILPFMEMVEGKSILTARIAKGGETYADEVYLQMIPVLKDQGLEMALPLEKLGVSGGDTLQLFLIMRDKGEITDYMPREFSAIRLKLPEYKPERKVLLELVDEEGDDFGPGTYTYPLNEVFKKGVFDLLGVTLRRDEKNLEFDLKFKDLGGNPWGGPYGFCLQVAQIYVDSKLGGITQPIFPDVPRIRIDEKTPYDFALQAGPGWSTELTNKLVFADGKEVIDQMKITCNQAKGLINILVPRNLIDPHWEEGYPLKLNVVVGSWDGYGINGWRNVGVKEEEYMFGGADAPAVVAGVSPLVLDILVPEDRKQETILKGYDPAKVTFAAIPLVGVRVPAEAVPVLDWKILVGLLLVVVIVVILLLKKRRA